MLERFQPTQKSIQSRLRRMMSPSLGAEFAFNNVRREGLVASRTPSPLQQDLVFLSMPFVSFLRSLPLMLTRTDLRGISLLGLRLRLMELRAGRFFERLACCKGNAKTNSTIQVTNSSKHCKQCGLH